MQINDPLIGQQVEEYLIEDLLGQGGMGRVYRGLDVKLHRYAAIKVMSHPDKKNNMYQKRFFREAKSIAKLEHGHIVTIYRYNDVNNIYYMAMQYVDGADLRWVLTDYVSNGELIDYPTLFKIMEHICLALDYAHDNGVIHRDIKPSNIMIARNGTAILTDFGLALNVAEGTGGEIFGSPHYIAPEQAVSSAQAVPQTDFYAMGVILYEMLTGSVPFNTGSALQIAMAHIGDKLPDPQSIKPDLHPAFLPILSKALEKSPADRYQTGTEFIQSLKLAIDKAHRDRSEPTVSHLGRPKDRIAKNIKPVVVQDTKPQTRLAPDDSNQDDVATKIFSEPKYPAKRRNFAGYYFLLIIALLALAFVLYPESDTLFEQLQNNFIADNSTQIVNARISGQVSSIDIARNEATLVIYSETIQIPRSSQLYAAIESATENNTIQDIIIEGHTVLQGETLSFDRVDSATIDGQAVEMNLDSE